MPSRDLTTPCVAPTMARGATNALRCSEAHSEQAIDAAEEAPPRSRGAYLWDALYDVDDCAVDVSFYLRDIDDTSLYSAPIRVTAQR